MASLADHTISGVKRRVAELRRTLIGIGAASLLVVVLAHVAERFDILPAIGWGLPHSPGHYLDLLSAIVGCISLLAALALWGATRRKTRH